MRRFRKSAKALAEEASTSDMSFDELEREVYATMTLTDAYDAIVATRLAKAYEQGRTRVLLFALMHVETPSQYWEASVEDESARDRFRAHFETYTPQGAPERLGLEDFLGAVEGARSNDLRLLSALVDYLQRIHYSFSMYRQRATARRDPRQLEPNSVPASLAHALGWRVNYSLTEYTLVTDLTLTRHRNQEVREAAAAARLLSLESTPRTPTSPARRVPVFRVTSSGSGPEPVRRAAKEDGEGETPFIPLAERRPGPIGQEDEEDGFEEGAQSSASSSSDSSVRHTKDDRAERDSDIDSDEDDVILTASDPPHPSPSLTASASSSSVSKTRASTSDKSFVVVSVRSKAREERARRAQAREERMRDVLERR